MNLPVAQACLSASDLKRIEHAAAHVRNYDTEQGSRRTPARPHGRGAGRRLPPPRLPVAPSGVVRERLVRRYGALVGDARVGIVHVPVDGRSVEIFALPVPPDSPRQAVADDERSAEHEVHHAFAVTAPGAVVPAGLRTLHQERGGAVPDVVGTTAMRT
ncbi:hypothetical protein QF037_001054 [Streptomyces canus]|uniref:hypothetical protein n=1 Tax=Streptomyces canus TaxID=58343 RepID=UPI00277D468D|nr:hypothetical protein [Streptomyces canus]MDQ0596709.1 hypothetical protein [Streptomyces canus]